MDPCDRLTGSSENEVTGAIRFSVSLVQSLVRWCLALLCSAI